MQGRGEGVVWRGTGISYGVADRKMAKCHDRARVLLTILTVSSFCPFCNNLN